MRSRDTTRLLLKGAGIAVFVILVIALEREFHFSRLLEPGRIEQRLLAAGPFAPVLFILMMCATVLSPVPTFPLDILAGRVFGPVLGTLYAVTGATLGATGSFLIARWLGRDLIARFLKGHINFCQRCSNRLLTKVVFLARLVPAVSFDMVSYGAGLTKMSLARFAIASFFGMLPLTFVYAWIGPQIDVSPTATLVGGGTVVALYFLLPRWIERRNFLGLRKLFEHDGEPEMKLEVEPLDG
ncbi:MAG: TVP38/TMEM64 family protein [Thermoanaerobaculia bacterium]|nr:TVP38/TMEM64 family protein [Thermoanaerobaculia bacterium]